MRTQPRGVGVFMGVWNAGAKIGVMMALLASAGPSAAGGDVKAPYTGAGFAGMSDEDHKTRHGFDAKSLR